MRDFLEPEVSHEILHQALSVSSVDLDGTDLLEMNCFFSNDDDDYYHCHYHYYY